jgi:Transglutaminase-like superfamily
MTEIPRFLAWPYRKKKLLFQVFYMVVCIRISLWVFPTKFFNTSISGVELAVEPRQPDWPIIHEVVAFVKYCSRFVPYTTCLTQALATRIVLRRLGQHCVLQIGVDKDQNHKFLAHAWIEVDGKIIIGRVRDISRYTVMSHSQELLV